jgi:hypothetical protein
MSQNEVLSSATRPTFSPAFSPELSEAHKQAVDKCTGIIKKFRSGNISKPKASVLLQQPFLTTMPIKSLSYQPMDHISTCSTALSLL